MPGGSKSSNNGFAQFMVDFRKREERRGKRYASLEEVVQPAGEVWSKMSSEEKAIYKLRAKENKACPQTAHNRMMMSSSTALHRPSSTKKKTANLFPSQIVNETSVDFYSYFVNNDDASSMYRRREKDRLDLYQQLAWRYMEGETNLGSILQESFFVMTVQNYYETPEHTCSPAEVALVEFSLSKGILNEKVFVLQPNDIPPQWMNVALDGSMKTHQFNPVYPPKFARDDWRIIGEEMTKFFGSSRHVFRLYVLTEQFNSAVAVFQLLHSKTKMKAVVHPEKVLGIEDLYSVLCEYGKEKVDRAVLSHFAEVVTSDQYFEYDPTMFCDYHQTHQTKYCSLAFAKKICYFLFDNVKKMYNIRITTKHIPDGVSFAKFCSLDESVETNASSVVSRSSRSAETEEEFVFEDYAADIVYDTRLEERRHLKRLIPLHFPPSMKQFSNFVETAAKFPESTDIYGAAPSFRGSSTIRKKTNAVQKLPGLDEVKWDD